MVVLTLDHASQSLGRPGTAQVAGPHSEASHSVHLEWGSVDLHFWEAPSGYRGCGSGVAGGTVLVIRCREWGREGGDPRAERRLEQGSAFI